MVGWLVLFVLCVTFSRLLGIEEFQWGTLTKTLFIGSHKWVSWLGLSDVKLYKKDRTKLVQFSVVINHFNKKLLGINWELETKTGSVARNGWSR